MKIRSVWVCFTGETEIGILRLLKKGFRHCCLVLEYDDEWLVLDPLSTYTDIERVSKKQVENVPHWLSLQEMFVLKAVLNRENIKADLLGVRSCVSFCKKVLGIRRKTIQTPWQLAQYIFHNQIKEIDMGKIIPKPKAPKVVVQEDKIKTDNRASEEEERRKRAAASGGLLSQTVKTSLRGVLSQNNDYQPQRKTLLGE